MVITPKRNGDVRICLDLINLNKAVKQEVNPMASVDENLAKVENRKVFSKLKLRVLGGATGGRVPFSNHVCDTMQEVPL